MISLKTISSPCKRVESWIRLFPCFDLTTLFFSERPPNLPFFQDSRNMWRFLFSENLWQAAGLGSASEPWPLTLPDNNLDDLLLGEEEKKPDTPRNAGFGKLIFPLCFGASLPKASHYRLILAKYRGPIELSEFKVTMAATAAILFFPFWGLKL